MTVEDDLAVLVAEGFKEVPSKQRVELQKWCEDAGMSETHPAGIAMPYRIHHVLNKGDVWVRVEQNIGMEPQPVSHPTEEGRLVEGPRDHTAAVIAYQSVVLVECPRGAVTLNNPDSALLKAVLTDLG